MLAVRGVVRLQVRRGAVLAERVVEVAHLLERVTQAVVGVGVCGVVADCLQHFHSAALPFFPE